MRISQKYSLINDLEKSLTTIFEDQDYDFRFNGEGLYVEEVFKSNMFLPLFLYDKQKYIYRFCVEELGANIRAQIILKQSEESVFNFIVHIENNFTKKEQYIKLSKFLASLIFTEINFNKKMSLDNKYNDWVNVMNQTLAPTN